MPAPRRTRHWWQEQVAALERSGLTHQQFAAVHGLAVASLRHWLYAERRAREVAALPALVEVEWRTPSGRTEPLAGDAAAVAFVGDVELRIASGADPAWLADLLGRLVRSVRPC